MPDNIKNNSPSTSAPDSISHGWETVNNGQTTTAAFSFPSESKAESDSEGPTVEYIEDIAEYTGDGDDGKDAVISGPLAERRVSDAITTTPTAAAVAVASEAVTEDAETEAGDYDGDTDAYAALHFWKSEAASGYRGGAAGKRPGVEEGKYTQAGLTAEKVFEAMLKRIQEMMGIHEARWKEEYDLEQDKKEDEYWNKYMAGSSSPALEPDSPGVEDSGAPARRQQYVQARQNRLNSVREGNSSASATTSSPSLPMPSPPRQTRQSSSATNAGITLPLSSPGRSKRETSTRDTSASKIGIGVSIPFPSPITFPARAKTSNSEAYGKALASFDALCQSFGDCVQPQERENMRAASNEASSSNDVNVNININININGNGKGSSNATNVNGDVNGTGTENDNDNDFPCDSTRTNEPDQEYDADGESSDPLALDAMIPHERANPSSPESEVDSGYEEGN